MGHTQGHRPPRKRRPRPTGPFGHALSINERGQRASGFKRASNVKSLVLKTPKAKRKPTKRQLAGLTRVLLPKKVRKVAKRHRAKASFVRALRQQSKLRA